MNKSPGWMGAGACCVDTDTMAIEVRPWPGQPGESGEGENADLDLVIHYYPGDGEGRQSTRSRHFLLFNPAGGQSPVGVDQSAFAPS